MRPVRRTSSPSLMARSLAEEHDADVVLFEVQRHADDAAGELEQLAGHDLLEAVDARDAVADGEDRAGLLDLDGFFEGLDLGAKNLADLFRLDLHEKVTSSRS